MAVSNVMSRPEGRASRYLGVPLFRSIGYVRNLSFHISVQSLVDRFAAIKVFVAIAEAGSLSGAGKRLGMPLSTVSRHLKALEDELETRLVTRTTRRLTLTERGRSYAATCRQVLDELDAAGRSLAGEHAEPRGELALTAPVVFGRLHVLPVVTAFLNAYPHVTARMLLGDRIVDLVEEGLDVGVRIGNLPDSSLRATRV